MKIIYVSGPMSNLPHLNYPEFHRVTKILRESKEYIVLNPAEYTLPDTNWEECLKLDLTLLRKSPS